MATMSIRHPWKYDVFVSFRGEDIRKTFVDHLFTYFKQIGFRAFRDDRELPKGEEISPHLYKAIEESRFLIVIFSKNYASSSWCLRELVKILECKQMGERKHEVRIIFYDVKPHVVRHQTESYAEAFKNLKRPEVEVEEWRKALSMVIDEWEKSLSKAANLSGWDLQDTTNGFEAEFIIKISNEILEMLLDLPLHVGENLVGVDILLDKLNLSRFVVSNDKVNRIGICGISGIGKTTLAKAIYNLMYDHFEGSCFCENIREERNLAEVQRHMIGKIMKTKFFDISNVSEGAGVLKQRMPCKPVLLVLDDVDDDEQLESLAGSASWFCKGSLIIFTCKDKQLLRSHGVDEIHEMDFLDEDRSLELFRSYAFKEKDYPIEFKRVSQEVVNYVQGHPLALKVLGRFLYGKTVGQWKSELKRLKVHPNEKIQRVLRLSYDGLDRCQQNILLDIACLFIGENSDFVASILDGCNFFAVTNMRVLFDKSLITVSRNNSLQMHGLIQAMAREIVSEESRRLLISSNVYDILSQNEVEITEAVEVLVISLEKFSQKVQIDAKDFALMKKLRILKIYQEEKVYYHTFPLSERKRELEGHDVIFSGENLDYLSNNLSLFYWHGCPFECLPSNFYPINIVAIDLSYSNIKHFWTTPKPFESLKVMKLTFCCNLTTTPDFSEIRNLEELNLEGCVNLVNVHPSIGKLGRLVVLNLRDCKRLQYFPSKQHPRSSVSLAGLRMLKDLNLSYCDLLEVCESIGGLSRLNCLYLQGNKKLEVLPSLGQLSHLQTLVLDGCRKLKVLPELPHSLDSLYASMCTSLREVSGSSKDRFKKRLNRFRHCPKLFENVTVDSEGSISKTQEHSIVLIRGGRVKDSPGVKSHCIRGVKDLLCLDSSVTSQGSIDQLSAFLGYLGFQTNRCEFFTQDTEFNSLNIVYPGNSIPEWFTNRSTENNVEVELPSEWCFNKFWGFGTCVVFKCKDPYKFKGYSVKSFDGEGYFRDLIRDYFPTSIRDYFRDKLTGVQDSYMIWLHYQRYTRKWAEATKSRTFWFEENNEDTRKWEEATESLTFCFEENNEDFEVKEFGVRLICDEDVEHLSMIQNLPTPTQHGGMLSLMGRNIGQTYWSW